MPKRFEEPVTNAVEYGGAKRETIPQKVSNAVGSTLDRPQPQSV